MDRKVKSLIAFALSGIFGIIAQSLLVVQVVDATIVNLAGGFTAAVLSLSMLSFGIANLIK